MKVIICGAGQVGYFLAKYLSSDDNDVTVIDSTPDVIQHVNHSLDVRGILGSASHPEILAVAGADEAEMLIAVTEQDEINMVACHVAHSLFKTPIRIARIREQNFLNPKWSSFFTEGNLPVDFIISPELEVAKSIKRILDIPGAFEVFDVINGAAKVIGLHMTEGMPILHTPLKHLKTLFPDVEIFIMGIMRNRDLILPTDEEIILPYDSIYILVETDAVHQSMRAFSVDHGAFNRVIILGSGGVGLTLAALLMEERKAIDVRIIEKDKERASLVAQKISSQALVIHGDALNAEILKEAGADQTDSVICVTNDDKVNLLASLLSKSFGTQRAIALVNEMTYSSLQDPMGIDAVISPKAITVSTILQYVRRGRVKMAYAIQDAKGEIMDIEIFSSSALVGREMGDICLPKGAFIASVAREEKLLAPKLSMVIESKDRFLMMVSHEAIKKVEKIFSSRI